MYYRILKIMQGRIMKSKLKKWYGYMGVAEDCQLIQTRIALILSNLKDWLGLQLLQCRNETQSAAAQVIDLRPLTLCDNSFCHLNNQSHLWSESRKNGNRCRELIIWLVLYINMTDIMDTRISREKVTFNEFTWGHLHIEPKLEIAFEE